MVVPAAQLTPRAPVVQSVSRIQNPALLQRYHAYCVQRAPYLGRLKLQCCCGALVLCDAGRAIQRIDSETVLSMHEPRWHRRGPGGVWSRRPNVSRHKRRSGNAHCARCVLLPFAEV